MGKKLTDLQKFKLKYEYIKISDEEWLKIYEKINQLNDLEKHNFMLNYIKKHNAFDTILNYLNTIEILEEFNSLKILNRLQTFFDFLYSLKYNLTTQEAEILSQKKPFTILFSKIFASKASISLTEFDKIINNNQYLEVICQYYMNENNIELVVDDKPDLNESKKSNRILSRQEVIELFKKVEQNDEEAKNKLIIANLPLVKSVAAKYKIPGMDYEDLVQEGTIGLIKAVEKFDYRKNNSFSTYAIWWIRQAIMRSLSEKARTIRLPDYVGRSVSKIIRVQNQLASKLNREPTDEELALELNVSTKKISKLKKYIDMTISLNEVVGEKENQELGLFIKDEKINVEQEALQNYNRDYIKKICKENLTKKEAKVIDLRFGLTDDSPKTLEEVGMEFNVSRERIRQIETRALKKLERALKVNKALIKPPEKEKIFYSTFDVKNIHEDLTLPVFFELLNILPQSDLKVYTKYRNIHLKEKVISVKKEQEYSKGFQNHMNLLEEDLRILFIQYQKYLNMKKLEKEHIFIYLKYWMSQRYLRYRFADYSFKEIKDAINKLSLEDQIILKNRYGKNFLTYHEFSENPEKNYADLNRAEYHLSNVLKQIREKTDDYNTKEVIQNSTVELPQIFEADNFKYLVSLLNDNYQKIMHIRYGQNLDEFNSWPKDKSASYYYMMHKKIVDKLKLLANSYLEMNLENQKSNFSKANILNKLDSTQLLKLVPLLPRKQQEVMYLIHGKNLDEWLSFSEVIDKKELNRYYANYANAKKNLLKLKESENINFDEPKNIIDGIGHEKLLKLVPLLPRKQQEVMYLVHGKNLDEWLPFPEVSDRKELNRYYANYTKAKKHLLKLNESENINFDKPKNIIDGIENEELLKLVPLLPRNQQEVMYLRHGKNLDEWLSFPEVSDKKEFKRYYVNYFRAKKSLLKLKESKNINFDKPKNIIDGIGHEKLLKLVPLLPRNQQEVMYLKHGKNLDEWHSFSEVSDEKERNRYYTYYGKAKKNLLKLNESENINFDEPKNIIDGIGHEKLLKLVPLLPRNQQEVMYLVHGKNLDEWLSFPEVTDKKELNRYYVNYFRAKKNLLKLNELENINFDKPKNIIDGIENEELLKLVPLLPRKQQEVMYLVHGKNLDEWLSFPEVSDKKEFNRYYANYENAKRSLLKLKERSMANLNTDQISSKNEQRIAEHKTQMQLEKAKSRKTTKKRFSKSIIDLENKEDIFFATKYLSDHQKEILFLRHGANLDTTNPWPDVPEGKSPNYYHVLYSQIKKRVQYIIAHRSEFENKNKIKKANEKLSKSIINDIEHNKLLKLVPLLTKKRQEIIYLRHGKNLDELNPWPNDKSPSYYYVMYHDIYKKLKSLEQNLTDSQEPSTIKMVETPKLPKKTANKLPKNENPKKILLENKKDLLKIKLKNQWKEKLYTEYYPLYKEVLESSTMENIISSFVDGVEVIPNSLDLSIANKIEIETMFIKEMARLYKENPNSEQSLNILLFLDDIYGNRLRTRFTSETSYCYINDGDISAAIELSLRNYDGRLPFYSALSVTLKRKLKK